MTWSMSFLLMATACVLASAGFIYRRTGDLFHPVLLFAAFAAFMYVAQPAYLLLTAPDDVFRFLEPEQVESVLVVNLFVLTGCFAGFALATRGRGRVVPPQPVAEVVPKIAEKRLLLAATILLVLGAVGYGTNLADYGWSGFLEIDAERYAEERPTGYLGELTHTLIAAAIVAGLLAVGTRYRLQGIILASVAILPWLLSAIAGGRRGPAAIGLLVLLFVFYFWRPRKIKIRTFAWWLAGLALVITFLIANRGTLVERRYGEWRPLGEAIYLQPFEGNEFIYGGAAIVSKLHYWDFYWGRRQLMAYVVRPVPRQIWPEKYQDAAAWLGLPDWIEANNAVFDHSAAFLLGWVAPLGAAPGFVADWWIDFGPLAPLGGGLVAYGLVWLWGRAREARLLANVVYGLAFVLMIYLVTQAGEAFFVRLLFSSVVVLVVFTICGVVRSRQRGAQLTSAAIPRIAALSSPFPGAHGDGTRGSLKPPPGPGPKSSTALCVASGRMGASIGRRSPR
ncbi:MAG: oligosaccharide repeat unit polymerase [Geminicoccaceae bacterium]|nr:oligosaccharide repeat unit polymerase [Geminicoccaceae bacterium]